MIDTHAHLFSAEYENDLPSVIMRAKEAGVEAIYLPNIDLSTVDPLLAVCETYPNYCFPMLGLHPTAVTSAVKQQLTLLKAHLFTDSNLKKSPFQAIGEIGIDLYWDKTHLKEQQFAFETQLNWGLEANLPIAIHCRESFKEVIEIVQKYKNTPLKGIFHSFVGTVEEAQQIIELQEFKMGINGVVTFKNSSLSEVLKQVPIQQLVLETDAPYLSPMPFRGKRNESAFVLYVLQKLATIYPLSIDEIEKITTANAHSIFKVPAFNL